MKKIIISPYSSRIKMGGNSNPKDYPYWNDLVLELKKLNFYCIQIGSGKEERLLNVDEFLINKNMKELEELLKSCHTWISIDNFFHHFAHNHNKKGFVIFAHSNPSIFGYPENINIFKSKDYFRWDQFGEWHYFEKNDEAFVKPETIIKRIKEFLEMDKL